MNKANNPQEIIVSGIHLELTAGLKAHVREKMEHCSDTRGISCG